MSNLRLHHADAEEKPDSQTLVHRVNECLSPLQLKAHVTDEGIVVDMTHAMLPVAHRLLWRNGLELCEGNLVIERTSDPRSDQEVIERIDDLLNERIAKSRRAA